MSNKILLAGIIGILTTCPAQLLAEDSKVNGEVDLTGSFASGVKDSAKSEEYRDLSNGAAVDLKLKYEDKEKGEYAAVTGENLSRNDEKITITGGQYGKYKVDLSYDQIPHNYAYGMQSIYSGDGSGNLTIAQPLSSPLASNTTQAQLVDRINSLIAANQHSLDVKTLRKTAKIKAEYSGLEKFKFRVDITSEQRDGGAPGMGSFGLGNIVELITPVNYDTSQLRLSGDYGAKNVYFSASYYLSVFHNEANSLSYDNPFRLTDSTSSGAYTNPIFANDQLYNSGAARALQVLAPDNIFHGPSMNAVIRNLPGRSQVTLAGSWGWMNQDDDLYAYTSNTAITGINGASTFNASDPANLPVREANADVSTALYSISGTSHPIKWLDISTKYRYYDYNNNTDPVTFPGYVRYDSSWNSEAVTTNPSSFSKQTASFDVGAKVTSKTKLGLEYKYEDTHRDQLEVKNLSDNIITASANHKFNDNYTAKVSYSHSARHAGDYDYTKPFSDEDIISQLPLLRKYNEATRDMDSINFLTVANITDDLSITGGFLYGNSNYGESKFGQLDDRKYQLSADVDYSVTKSVNLKTFYSYEHHNGSQAATQWVVGGIGDPALQPSKAYTNSSWTADTTDVVHTIGAGVTATLIQKKLFFDMNYSYSLAEGDVDFASPLGTSSNDSNAFDPASFDQVDSTRAHRLVPSLRYKATKDLTVSLGYLWEKFTFNDFQGNGYTSLPTTSSGGYNGAILGNAYPYKDYDLSMIVAGIKYRF